MILNCFKRLKIQNPLEDTHVRVILKILVEGRLNNSSYCINALNGEKLKLHSLFKIIKAIIIFINEIEIKDKRNGLTFVLTFLFLLHPFVGLRDVGKIVFTLGSLILLTKISSCFSYLF